MRRTKAVMMFLLLGAGFDPLQLAGIAPAAATTVDGSLCGLSAKKIEQGYVCDEQRSVLYSELHLDLDGTNECQDRDLYSATWSIIGRNGKTNEKKSVISDDPITGEWGEWYAGTPAPTFEDPLRTLCNYDIVLTTG